MAPLNTAPRGPLKGVTVVDFTLAYAGPFATLLLGGLGASVIKVENPQDGDMSRGNPPFIGREGVTMDVAREGDMSLAFINRARNKKSVTLNLKHEQSKAIIRKLIATADIFVENFAPGVVERLGIDYASLKAINPRIIYCSIKGFGTGAPPETGRAMDIMIQARSGLMAATGRTSDPPMRSGLPIGDLVAPMTAVIGILAALWHREKTGEGQFIDISMLDVLTALVAGEHFDALTHYGLEIRTGNSLARMSPFGAFETADGDWVAIAAPTDLLANQLFASMGKDYLLADKRFATRNQRTLNSALVEAEIQEWSGRQTTAEMMRIMNAHGVPATEVKRPEEAVHDPLVLARKGVVPLSHPRFGAPVEMMGTGMPIIFSATPCEFSEPAPMLGQHNDDVYGALGYTAKDLQSLQEAGVI
jgi:CoA:oxalate CoA-transferase